MIYCRGQCSINENQESGGMAAGESSVVVTPHDKGLAHMLNEDMTEQGDDTGRDADDEMSVTSVASEHVSGFGFDCM